MRSVQTGVQVGLRWLDELLEGCVCIACANEGTKLPNALLQGEVL